MNSVSAFSYIPTCRAILRTSSARDAPSRPPVVHCNSRFGIDRSLRLFSDSSRRSPLSRSGQ
jgi:hypothetical protein